MSGIGQGVPLHAVERCTRPRHFQPACQYAAANAFSAQSQILTNARGIVVRFELRFGDRRAFAYGARLNGHQSIAAWCAPAGAPALSHVFRHPGEPFALAGEAVPLVDPAHDVLEQHAGNWILVRDALINDAHAGALRIALEHDGDDRLPREPACIEQQHGVPCPLATSHVVDESRQSGAVFVATG